MLKNLKISGGRGNIMNPEETEMIAMLSRVVDKIKDWIIISNLSGRIIYANQVIFRDTLCKKEEIIGEDLCTFLGVNLSGGETIRYMHSLVNKDQKIEFITSRTIMGNKKIYLVNTLTSIWTNNNKRYYVCLSKDISPTLKLKEEAYKAYCIDPLTNYPNQKKLVENLDYQISKAPRLALILLDVASLGEINTYYGMHIGDIIIKAVGERIKKEMTPKQEIFKFTGDIFAILHKNLEDDKEIDDFLTKVNHMTEIPIQIQNRYFYIYLQESIAVYPNEAIDGEQLIERALVALEHIKRQRKHQAAPTYYSKAIEEENKMIQHEEADLQQAITNDEFIVYYQPIINLKENKLVGLEALIRRQTSSGQIILPGAFIDTLERMNLIEHVGSIVLEKVCIQVHEWLEKGFPVVPISVNLSALQFRNPHLAEFIEGILEKYNIDPKYIVLEVTESMLIEDVEVAQKTIDTLRNYGILISIDDFGTGFASIGYLKNFMFEHLKIDISFIREIAKSTADRTIVEAIITIAKTLHLKTIAEGIEDEEQLNIVSSLGCEMGQGYFWNSPITPQKIEEKYFNVCIDDENIG